MRRQTARRWCGRTEAEDDRVIREEIERDQRRDEKANSKKVVWEDRG